MIADLHCDTLLELEGGADLRDNPEGHVDLPRLRSGDIQLQVFVAFVSTTYPVGRAFHEANVLLDLLEETCDRHAEHLARASTVAEIERAAASGKIASVPAVENGHAIESDLRKLEALARRGIRYLTLTHSAHLPWAASSGQTGEGPGGLTRFGREVVTAMRDLGIVVDLSHVHARTFWDAIRVARRPVMASHSCASALCPSARNLTDDQIKAIRDTGGVVGINFFPGYLDPRYFARLGGDADLLFAFFEQAERDTLDNPVERTKVMRALTVKWRERVGPVEADLDTVCDHVEYVTEIAGEDGVAFGSDFDGIPDLPRGLADCAAFPALLARLRTRGAPETRLRKLAWENVLRVLRENE